MSYKTVEVNKQTYVISKMNAIQQFHIARRLATVYGAVYASQGIISEGDYEKGFKALFSCLSSLSDEDSNFCLYGLLQCVSLKGKDGGNFPVMLDSTTPRNSEMRMMEMIALAYHSLTFNVIDDFFLEEVKALWSQIQDQIST